MLETIYWILLLLLVGVALYLTFLTEITYFFSFLAVTGSCRDFAIAD